MVYQLLIEITMFVILTITSVSGLKGKYFHIFRLLAVCVNFVLFVVQPLFYLNGDANFRNRVSQKGLWKALKTELFQLESSLLSEKKY